MKIALGIDGQVTEQDIENFVNEGADEFFCGIMLQDWTQRYGYAVSLNKRFDPATQFSGFGQLQKIIDKIHFLGKAVFVTFNAHAYTKEQLPLVESYLRRIAALNPDAIIVTDIALLVFIRDAGLNFKIHIGGDAGAYNSGAVRFFHKLGVTRIKFPRDMSIVEMSRVISETRALGLEYEAFIMEQRCPFSGVACRGDHGLGPADFCYQTWQKFPFVRLPSDFAERYLKSENGSQPEDIIPKSDIRLIKKWNANTAQYHMWTIGGLFPIFKKQDHLLRECGLCAIKRLKEIGVDSLKIVSRGKKVEGKLANLKVVKKVLDSPDSSQDFCKEIRNSPEICGLGYMCYYPEARLE